MATTLSGTLLCAPSSSSTLSHHHHHHHHRPRFLPSLNLRLAMANTCGVKCSLQHSPQNQKKFENRRVVSVALLLLHCFSKDAKAGNLLDKYVKRKKLDPLEAYVPAVLLSISQFEDLERTLEFDQPKYATCRSLLRSGPAASLRINIRAVAEYASEDGRGKAAIDAVDKCLRALEELDSLMLHASRNDPDATISSMKAKIVIAVGALDSLLQTVPSAILNKGKAIADAYRMPEDDTGPESLDPDLKKLEELL